jgi:hypothetical protein
VRFLSFKLSGFCLLKKVIELRFLAKRRTFFSCFVRPRVVNHMMMQVHCMAGVSRSASIAIFAAMCFHKVNARSFSAC